MIKKRVIFNINIKDNVKNNVAKNETLKANKQ